MRQEFIFKISPFVWVIRTHFESNCNIIPIIQLIHIIPVQIQKRSGRIKLLHNFRYFIRVGKFLPDRMLCLRISGRCFPSVTAVRRKILLLVLIMPVRHFQTENVFRPQLHRIDGMIFLQHRQCIIKILIYRNAHTGVTVINIPTQFSAWSFAVRHRKIELLHVL